MSANANLHELLEEAEAVNAARRYVDASRRR